MPPKSAVERSEHRDEIDDLLLDGRSPRFVSSYLKNEYNESISHTAINNYKKKHLDVTKEAVIDYTNKKSKEGKEVQSQKNREKKKEKVVKKISSDLEKLDEIIEDINEIISNVTYRSYSGRDISGLRHSSRNERGRKPHHVGGNR